MAVFEYDDPVVLYDAADVEYDGTQEKFKDAWGWGQEFNSLDVTTLLSGWA